MVDGWSKRKIILNSTQVEVVVEDGVGLRSLGNGQTSTYSPGLRSMGDSVLEI